ncbi:helix-turn-helix transcriptional regulator [Demequina sp. SO4-18]|uniref:helix-turn-helix transcriptional regulator n=1 Tax=Demequina sp. SO4-18 TaxID=3401026 RepID=UPI003B5BDC0B
MAAQSIGEVRDMTWVSERTGVPINTLRYWRHLGQGPQSFRLGRRVVYAVSDVEAWIEAARSKELATA